MKYYIQQPKDAFAVLMSSQREKKLPAMMEGGKLRGDQRLRNGLIYASYAVAMEKSPTLGEQVLTKEERLYFLK